MGGLNRRPAEPAAAASGRVVESLLVRRRRDILRATRGCVGQRGFHRTTMADIARAAGLGMGQLYRCFPDKEAIIRAIAADYLSALGATLDQMRERQADLPDLFTEGDGPARLEEPLADRAALVLEIHAEAARNLAIADVVQAAGRQKRALLRQALGSRRPPGWSQAHFEAHCELIEVLQAGVLVQAVLRPDADHQALLSLAGALVQSLWSSARDDSV